MKNYENDVYVIGGKKRVAWLRYAIIVLCIAAGVILIGWLTRDSQLGSVEEQKCSGLWSNACRTAGFLLFHCIDVGITRASATAYDG